MTNYYARKEYVYTGGDAVFSIPFAYIKIDYIKVYVNDTLTTNWTLLNSSQIQITSTLSNNDKVSIVRETPLTSKLVTFTDTSILDEDAQNLAQDQLFDAVQEIYDNNIVFEAIVDDDINSISLTANSALSNSETAINTANAANSAANSAVNTANTAETKADNAVSTANSASSAASSAVTTANAANSAAATAISTANSADSKADTAIDTADEAKNIAETASDTADSALSKSTTALSNSQTAVSNASTALSNSQTAINTANSAANDAASAITTANSASDAATSAITTANSASSTANSAITTANSASTAASNAVSTANTANTNATTAVNKADEAISIAQTAVSQGITPATTSELGGIIVGNNLSITAAGVLSADAQAAGNGTVTFTQGGVTKGTITMNQSNNTTINLDAGGDVDQTYDSTSAKAQSGVAINGAGFLQNTATGNSSITVNGTATAKSQSINIGTGSQATGNYSTALGTYSFGNASHALGIGNYAKATADYAIQLNKGTNSTSNSLYVGFDNNNYQLLDGTTGLIPDARISTNIARTTNIPTATSDLTNDSGFITSIPIATSSTLGIVQPDNSTITVDANGRLTVSGGGTWGSISGTLSDQTDLQDALDDKVNSSDIWYDSTSQTIFIGVAQS